MKQIKGDDMEILIGKIFFLISSVWAVAVLFRIAASLLAHRRQVHRNRGYLAPPPVQAIYSEKPKRVHS
jgi:hypothetical protein